MTSMIRGSKTFRQEFMQFLVKPKLPPKPAVFIPSTSRRSGVIGTAVDYLFRFQLERTCQLRDEDGDVSWVADHSLSLVSDKKLRKQMEKDLRHFHQVVHDYVLGNSEVTAELIRTALLLSNFDVIFRTGAYEEFAYRIEEGELEELENIMRQFPEELLSGWEHLRLNPTFLSGGYVGGADADLILDDHLVEIKTCGKWELRLRDFLQLMGYVLLQEIDNTARLEPEEIVGIGVYYPRFCTLVRFPLSSVFKSGRSDEALAWFKEKVGFKEEKWQKTVQQARVMPEWWDEGFGPNFTPS